MRRLIVIPLAIVSVCSVAPARAAVPWLAPPTIGPILRHFEPPPDPYSAGHRGIDIGQRPGAVLGAPAAGVVTFAGFVAGERYVTVDHGEVRTTCSFVGSLLVVKGEQVVRDQPIATVGAGHPGSTRSHVHVSLRRGDEYLDPEPAFVQALKREPWRVTRLVPAA